jgi:hypothetical protein
LRMSDDERDSCSPQGLRNRSRHDGEDMLEINAGDQATRLTITRVEELKATS